MYYNIACIPIIRTLCSNAKWHWQQLSELREELNESFRIMLSYERKIEKCDGQFTASVGTGNQSC